MIAPASPPVLAPVRFVIPGPPVSWSRAGRGMGARTGGAFVTFTPAKQRNWTHVAQAYMREAMAGRALFDGPLVVRVVAKWPRPKSVPKRDGPDARPRPSRPDADNVGKIVCDAGNGVLWLDDAQVVRLIVEKWVAAQGEGPCVAVTVEAA